MPPTSSPPNHHLRRLALATHRVGLTAPSWLFSFLLFSSFFSLPVWPVPVEFILTVSTISRLSPFCNPHRPGQGLRRSPSAQSPSQPNGGSLDLTIKHAILTTTDSFLLNGCTDGAPGPGVSVCALTVWIRCQGYSRGRTSRVPVLLTRLTLKSRPYLLPSSSFLCSLCGWLCSSVSCKARIGVEA
jgi:hypothetical protein